MASALNAAEQLVQSSDQHKTQAVALGGIAVTRLSLEAAAQNIECTNPVANNQTGQIDCPLRENAMLTRTLAYTVWPQNSFTVPLESVGRQALPQDVSTHSTGQYL
jgi:hypothetical protein